MNANGLASNVVAIGVYLDQISKSFGFDQNADESVTPIQRKNILRITSDLLHLVKFQNLLSSSSPAEINGILATLRPSIVGIVHSACVCDKATFSDIHATVHRIINSWAYQRYFDSLDPNIYAMLHEIVRTGMLASDAKTGRKPEEEARMAEMARNNATKARVNAVRAALTPRDNYEYPAMHGSLEDPLIDQPAAAGIIQGLAARDLAGPGAHRGPIYKPRQFTGTPSSELVMHVKALKDLKNDVKIFTLTCNDVNTLGQPVKKAHKENPLGFSNQFCIRTKRGDPEIAVWTRRREEVREDLRRFGPPPPSNMNRAQPLPIGPRGGYRGGYSGRGGPNTNFNRGGYQTYRGNPYGGGRGGRGNRW
jgi:hypothetical protein